MRINELAVHSNGSGGKTLTGLSVYGSTTLLPCCRSCLHCVAPILYFVRPGDCFPSNASLPPHPPHPLRLSGCDRSKSLVCSSSGDPHVRTFVGRRSHPMGQGEYVLAACGAFRVHACHEPLDQRPGVSRNNGFAVDSPWGRVDIARDGARVPPGAGIAVRGRRVTFPDGAEVVGTRRSLSVKFPGACCGRTSGLCGAFSPHLEFADVFTDAGGRYADFRDSRWRGPYGGGYQRFFVESWRVTDPARRLFTEAECPTGPAAPEVLPEEPPVSECPNADELQAKAEVCCRFGVGRVR